MSDAQRIIDRVRALGANIVLDGNGLRLVNKVKLSGEAIGYITKHRDAIAMLLREDEEAEFEECAAIIEYDGGAPREWAEQFARVLISRRPPQIDDLDWSWFITACGRIVDEAPARRVA